MGFVWLFKRKKLCIDDGNATRSIISESRLAIKHRPTTPNSSLKYALAQLSNINPMFAFA